MKNTKNTEDRTPEQELLMLTAEVRVYGWNDERRSRLHGLADFWHRKTGDPVLGELALMVR